jgi:hypothetical protein
MKEMNAETPGGERAKTEFQIVYLNSLEALMQLASPL